ncbi:MAG: hypothetical protein RLZZ522_526, partial [Verrucomicrobiota bacterium]
MTTIEITHWMGGFSGWDGLLFDTGWGGGCCSGLG